MQITVIGYIIIPLSIIMFFVKPEVLYYLTIFFSAFTASSVFNNYSSKTGIQPVFLVGALWLLYLLIKNIRIFSKEKLSINFIKKMYFEQLSKYQKKFIIAIIAFWSIGLLSLLMPFIMANKISVISPDGIGLIPLSFRKLNLTQFIYLTFVLLISTTTVIEVKTKESLNKSIKYFLYGTLFTSLWGIFQFLCFYLKIKYPDYIFNNNIAYYQGWHQMIFKIKRVSSVATEPSMFAIYILMMLPIVIVLWINEVNIINKKLMNTILVFSLFVAILTTSTAAYLGLTILIIVLISLYIYYLTYGKNKNNIKKLQLFKHSKKIIKVTSFIFALIFIMLIAFILIFKIDLSVITDMIKVITIDKAKNESGIERSGAFLTGIKIFLNSPILGVGWASNRTFDFFTTLLSNTGILGFVTFINILYVSLKSAKNSMELANNVGEYSIALSSALSLSMGILSLFTAIPDIIFVYFWIIISFPIILSNVEKLNSVNYK